MCPNIQGTNSEQQFTSVRLRLVDTKSSNWKPSGRTPKLLFVAWCVSYMPLPYGNGQVSSKESVALALLPMAQLTITLNKGFCHTPKKEWDCY